MIRGLSRWKTLPGLCGLVAVLVMLPEWAHAAMTGADYWQSLRDVWFGAYGAIFGVVGFIAVLFIAGRFGIGAGIGGLAMLVVFFLIPALVVAIQTFGRSALLVTGHSWV